MSSKDNVSIGLAIVIAGAINAFAFFCGFFRLAASQDNIANIVSNKPFAYPSAASSPAENTPVVALGQNRFAVVQSFDISIYEVDA